jgi:hypothetical protein
MLGPHLLPDSVLCDPEGLLGAVQPSVRHEWAQLRWVQVRCEEVKRDSLQNLDLLQRGASLDERLFGLYNLVIDLAALLAVASLRTPTHRRCLALAQELLVEAGRADLHEALLGLLGHAALGRAEIEAWIGPVGQAFDRAVAVHRSPSPFDFKLHAHIRPIFVEGAWELVDEGLHREAMLWLSSAYYIANAAIQNDGDEAEKLRYRAEFARLFDALASDGAVEWQVRALQARRIADEIFALADQIAARDTSTT